MLKYLKCADEYITAHEKGSKLYACECHFEKVITATKATATFVQYNTDADRLDKDPTYAFGFKWFRNDVQESHLKKRKSIQLHEERSTNRDSQRLKEEYEHQDPVVLGLEIQSLRSRFTMIIFS